LKFVRTFCVDWVDERSIGRKLYGEV